MDQNDPILIINSKVFTADPLHPFAEAVVISGQRIDYVGSTVDARAQVDSNTRVIDGQGCTLIPGIIDSHYHLMLGSSGLGHIQAGEVRTLDDLREILHEHRAAHPDKESYSVMQLPYDILPNGELLTRQHLDSIMADRPLLAMSFDAHTVWANTPALETAGVLHGAETGPNSEIVMAEDRTAIGELREPAAYGLVLAHFADWARMVKGLGTEIEVKLQIDEAQDRALLQKGLSLAAQWGITSVHNMDGDFEQASLYAAMEDAGELSLRVYVPYSVNPKSNIQDLDEVVEMLRTFQGNKVRAGSAKFFMDGVAESWTALLTDDYLDRPGWKGDALFSAEHFNQMAMECDKRGLQIKVHAIGDAAVRRTLDGFEYARKVNGARDSRHRIEHIELVHLEDLPRFAELGVIASMQPLHAPYDYPATAAEAWLGRIGQARWHRAFAWQYLRGAGARLVFGSDWPVVTADPMLGLYAATNRSAWGAEIPDHRQSLHDALVSYTHDGAYAEFQESTKGQIKAGMLADVVLLSADLFQTPTHEIKDVRPVLTICDGEIVYEA